MVTKKECIEQFKRECKSYNFYLKKIIECDEHIEMLDVRLQGVSSPNGNTNEKTSGSGTHPSPICLIVEQDEWKKERSIAMYHVEKVDVVLNQIKSAVDRAMVRDMYINNRYYPTLADKYGYNSKQSLLKHVNSVLKKIM